MTQRGRSVLGLGVVVYIAAWAFGSKPLYPVATGLVLVTALAWLWLRLAAGPYQAWRRVGPHDNVEGDDVSVRAEVEPGGLVLPPVALLVERVGRLGEHRLALRRTGRRLRVEYELTAVRRGRYAFEDVRVEVSDPFGLRRATITLPAPGALLVVPRLVPLDRLFTESGAHALEGRRLLMRRPSGFDLHSVRQYEDGDSLRKVHWASTARRGQLMVKELEDAPRDEIAVLLDASANAVVGDSFDVQVRAAGSILDAYVARGRRAVLVVNADRRESRRVHSQAGERRRALELLAEAEATAATPLTTLLGEESSPAARALELVVVTARVDAALADRLVQRSLGRRKVSLVYVDTATFAGAARRPEPLLLRLQSAGVAVAVVAAGDDLGGGLSGMPSRQETAAHG